VFDVITKREYWEWQDEGFVDPQRVDLKGIQDAYVLSRLADVTGQRVLEIGGGNSRVLAAVGAPGRMNECWNAEKFEGFAGGPTANENAAQVRHANCFVGEFSSELPNAYFDYVISVSVVEHVPTDRLESFFADTARVLKRGGRIIHAIDAYLFDHDAGTDPARWTQQRITALLRFADRPDLGIRLTSPPVFDGSGGFRCSYASNSDLAMNSWNRLVPELRPVREVAQSVSIKAEWIKHGADER
jgi:SAM-dependent methyltransferase